VPSVGISCQYDTGSEGMGRSSPSALIALGPMSTAASESAPQRIATIREQLKLLGDYL
jgi:hypothetical protein